VRRIVAIVLPQLACEIARRKRTEAGKAVEGPIGVVLVRDGTGVAGTETAILDAVEDEARRYGVRAGQRVTEAAALLARISVNRVTYGEIDAALGRVAEVALSFGPLGGIQIREAPEDAARTPWGDAPFDTVWLDVTGSAHLVGGEEALLSELEERLGALGHRARLAIASGPRVAQALARWAPGIAGTPGVRASGRYAIAEGKPEGDARALAPLPVQALALDPDTVSFLLRIGVFTVGDLARLPRPKAAARLGPRAAEVLALVAGHDEAPILPYAPPREIVEEASFDDGVETTEALLFVLRAMASRASVRLAARGEACTRLTVEIPLDRSIARLRLAARGEAAEDDIGEDETVELPAESSAERLCFHLDLPAPLVAEGDLLRALRARLERTPLFAPAVGVVLRVSQIVAAPRVQLDLSREKAADPDSLPALLAELSAEIGADRVGLLAIEDAHRPEASSRLVPVTLGEGPRKKRTAAQLSLPGEWSRPKDPLPPPARLLPAPIPLGKVTGGGVVAIGSGPRAGGEPHLFAIEQLTHLMRLEGVEWWTRSPASRDYARAWLVSGGDDAVKGKGAPRPGAPKAAGAEALVYVVRKTGEMYLQGWYE
jgi:protein ImuB